MKKQLYFAIAWLLCITATAQVNLDFESGNFTGWTGRVGYTSGVGQMTAVGSPTIWTTGVNANLYVQSYHTIMTGAGNDYFGPFPRVAPGGSFSARLGNMGTNVNTTGDSPADCSGITPAYYAPGTDFINGPIPAPWSGAESLEQSFVVTAANAMVTLQYAAVFNNGTHSGAASVNPWFRAEVLNSSGTPISSCLTYTFVLNTSGLPSGSAKSTLSPCWYPAPATSSVVVYMPWQQKIFDLTSVIGQTVTVRFSAGGCDEGGHFGYAYIDASAGPKSIIQTGGAGCTGPITLTGPTQYGSTYSWSGPSGGITASSANSATVNASGIYTLTVGGTCPVTFTTSVSLSTPSITVVPSNQTVCSGGNIAAMTFTSNPAGAVVSWTNTNTSDGLPATGSGDIGAYTSPTVTTQQVGVITAVPSFSGCTGPAKTFTVTINPYPSINPGTDKVLTCASPSVTITGSSPTPGTSYSWTGPSSGTPAGSAPTTTATSVTAPGSYTLTAAIGSCSTSAIVSVGSNTTSPNISAASNPTVTCSTTTAVLSGTSTTSGATYSWSPGGTSPTTATTSVSSAGNYTLMVTDPSNNCKASTVVSVISNTTQPNASAGSSPTITCSNATVTLNGSSSTPGAGYSWTGPAAATPAGSTPTNSTTIVNANGTYTLTVTDPANGCVKTAMVSVNSNTTAPNVNAGTSPTITCSSSTVTLNGSSSTPGAGYSWTGPAAATPAGSTPTNSTTVVNANGSYTLTVTNPANGCTATSAVAVTTNSTQPQVSAGTDQLLTCAASSATISGSSSTSGATYSWTGPSAGTPAGTTPTSTTTAVSSAGSYTFTVTNPLNGCTNFAVVSVATSSAIPQITADANPTITCAALTAVLSGTSSTSGVTYAWSGPGTANPAGTTPNTYSTSVTAPGIYTLTVTDPSNFCQAQYPVTVISNTTNPSASAGASQTITCSSATVQLQGSSSSPGVNYSWTGPQTGAPAGSTPTNSITAVTDAGTYTLTVIDPSNFCLTTSVVSVTTNTSAPNVNAGTTQTLTCSSTSVTLNGSSSTAGVNYSWTGPAAGAPAGSAPTTSVTSVSTAGTYTLLVTDPVSGCMDSATVNVMADAALPQITAGANQTITCVASSVTLTGASTNTNVTYSWTGPTAGVPAGSAPTTTATAVSADGTYTLTVTDPSNNCTATQQISVSTNTTTPVLSINVGGNGSTVINCSNSSVTFTGTATGNTSVVWTGPSGPMTGNPVVINTSGVYTVTATDNGSSCITSNTIAVITNTTAPTLTASVTADTINCANPSTSFTAASGSNSAYSWNGPGSFASTQQNPGGINTAGVYTVTVTDTTNGCTSTSTLTVVQGTNPAVSFTNTPSTGYAPLNVDFTNTSTGGFTGFGWSFGNQGTSTLNNPSTVYTDPGTYTVVLIGIAANAACNDTATTTIVVNEEDAIEIPNVFTPNGDGSNDVFHINSKGYKDLKVEIFNRWGQLLATLEGIHSSWDGTSPNGSKVPDGTYFYILTATSSVSAGKTLEKQGYITLLR